MLVMSDPPRENYEQRLNQVKRLGKPVEEIDHEERCRRYPAFRHDSESFTFLDVEAGVLKADKSLRCFQVRMFVL